MKNMNRHLTEEDVQMANKHMNRCSTSYVIREMQVKLTVRYYYNLLKQLRSKTLTISNADRDVDPQEFSFIAGGNSERNSHGKHLIYNTSVMLLDSCGNELNTCKLKT